jgi:hypothetical protein
MSELISITHIKQLARAAAETAPVGTHPEIVSPWPVTHYAYPAFEREFLQAQNELIFEEAD